MIPYIQKKFGIKDGGLVQRMYEGDLDGIVLSGRLNPELTKEILDTGRESLKIKDAIPLAQVFDFSLADEASQ